MWNPTSAILRPLFVLLILLIRLISPAASYGQLSQTYHALLIKKADSLRIVGNRREAEMAYRQALIFDKESLAALKGLGKIAYERKSWEEAQKWFRQALRIDPNDFDARYFFANPKLKLLLNEADSLRTLAEYGEARAAYTKALKIDRESVRALNGLGKIGYEKQDWKEVKKWFMRVLQVDPENEQANFHLTTSPNPKVPPIIEDAKILMDLGKYPEAKEYYLKALKIYPGVFQAFLGLGEIAFASRNWGEVKKWYNQAVEIQPLNLEAHYCLGVAYRETGKTKNKLVKTIQFGKSAKHFDAVVAVDSCYRDVLYQRGLLERWKKNWQRALRWAQRQVSLKPQLLSAQVGLYKLFNLHLFHKGEKETLTYLKEQSGDWAGFFMGEVHRRQERFAKADTYFETALGRDSGVSKTLVYLSLLRMALQLGSDEAASDYFEHALASIQSHTDAEFMFEDAKSIFQDSELKKFRKLKSGEDKRKFFVNFWMKRNPVPASPINWRVIEHYKRLHVAENRYWFYGVRAWFNNPDKRGYRSLPFPKAYFLNEEFNDKGLIYIRHGEPDNRAIASGNFSATYESWKYDRRGPRPELVFHFVLDVNAVENNWRLTSFPIEPKLLQRLIFAGTTLDPDVPGTASIVLKPNILEQLLGWNPTLDRFIFSVFQGSAARMEFSTVVEQIKEESEATIAHALTSDYHTWDKKTRFLDMAYTISHFRGADDKTRVEISYAIPLMKIFNKKPPDDGLHLEHGVAIYDTLFSEEDRFTETVRLKPDRALQVVREQFIHRQTFNLEPNTYRFSLFARTEEPPKIGGWNFKAMVPPYRSPILNLSDIELAYEITPSPQSTVFAKHDLQVKPNPTKRFESDQPVYLYYEIYNLERDEAGNTSFEVEHTMTQLRKKRSGLRKLIGSAKRDGKKSLSIKAERQGKEPTSIEFALFDVSNLASGTYALSVRVADLISGTEIAKSVILTIQ